MEDVQRLVEQFKAMQKQQLEQFEEMLHSAPLSLNLSALTFSFEETDIYSDSWEPVGVFGGHFALRTPFQLRKKTSEEIAAETHSRVEEILERNSKSAKTCITCGKVIQLDEELITTIHGFYHGAPKTCVEGR